ncbi:MAG: hypothetical protein AAF805_07780 [Planctomycetota bacterium]
MANEPPQADATNEPSLGWKLPTAAALLAAWTLLLGWMAFGG